MKLISERVWRVVPCDSVQSTLSQVTKRTKIYHEMRMLLKEVSEIALDRM